MFVRHTCHHRTLLHAQHRRLGATALHTVRHRTLPIAICSRTPSTRSFGPSLSLLGLAPCRRTNRSQHKQCCVASPASPFTLPALLSLCLSRASLARRGLGVAAGLRAQQVGRKGGVGHSGHLPNNPTFFQLHPLGPSTPSRGENGKIFQQRQSRI